MSSFPIGFFDSGIGGISLWKAIKKILPNENSIYLSDSKNCPYGLKSKDKLDEICIKNTEFLIDKGCKMIMLLVILQLLIQFQFLEINIKFHL